MNIFGNETSFELMKILIQESSQSNYVSPKPTLSRKCTSSAFRFASGLLIDFFREPLANDLNGRISLDRISEWSPLEQFKLARTNEKNFQGERLSLLNGIAYK